MRVSSFVVNAAWVAAQATRYLQFRSALTRAQAEQETLLTRYLRRNAHTDFGRRFDFVRIKSVDEYQQRVPLSIYEDYEPSIARIASGAANVLTATAVRCLEPTSGSTRAAKLVPYTRDLQAEFGRAIAPWIVDLALATPAIIGGPAYWSITPLTSQPPVAGRANSERPTVGFESDSAYLGGWLGWLADRTLVACDDLKRVQDVEEFRRNTLLRLLSEPELRLLSVWHPTFLTLLLDALAASWDGLLRDLARGLPPTRFIRGLPRNPARARELANADPLKPKSIWPHLALVSCWGDGHAAALIPGLQRRLGGVQIQAKGLIATEAFVSLPFAGHHPLAIRSHFFEFIDAHGSTKLAWQLELGQTYSVVVTTGGGLYRYQLRDRVVVQEFLGDTPCIRFVGKEDSVSDLYGEKLSEGLVAEIISRLIRSRAPEATFALLAPESDENGSRYVLYVASAEIPIQGLEEALETELAANPNYAQCVRLGQLKPAIVERVDADAAARYLDALRRTGQRLGNVKPAALSPLAGWRRVFQAYRSA
jgi:hypothetical protein